MLRQSLQLRAEQERTRRALPSVIERLLADPVARKDQLTFPPIPQREREHPDGVLQRPSQPPGFDRREQGLRVGMAGPIRRLPFVLQLLAKLLMIIDFAVVDDDVAAAVRVHRLIAGRRNVDDREAVVGEAYF